MFLRSILRYSKLAQPSAKNAELGQCIPCSIFSAIYHGGGGIINNGDGPPTRKKIWIPNGITQSDEGR